MSLALIRNNVALPNLQINPSYLIEKSNAQSCVTLQIKTKARVERGISSHSRLDVTNDFSIARVPLLIRIDFLGEKEKASGKLGRETHFPCTIKAKVFHSTRFSCKKFRFQE